MDFYNLFANLKMKLDDNPQRNSEQFAPEVPQEVRLFLGRLSMLQGVPPEYLVPDEKLLPKFRLVNGEQEECGSLRFFWIDPAWIECLLDGALSIGPDADRELLLKNAMGGVYLAEAFQKELIERLTKQLSGSYTPEEFRKEMAERMRAKGVQAEDDFNKPVGPPPTLTQDNWRFTGFLLRSSLISGWRGLEIKVEGTDFVNAPGKRILQLIRMEKIAPDTLFCLCEGIVTNIVISQPPEGMHFGLNSDNEMKDYTKKFTGLSKETKAPSPAVAVPLRISRSGGAGKRVIRIKGGGNGLADLALTTNSADFAMEMIAQPVKNEIEVTWERK